MATRHGFFDSQSGDRVYTADDFSRPWQWASSDGFVVGFNNELKVNPTSPASGDVRVETGSAFVQGRFFQVYSSAETLTVPTSDGTNPRIDRVVVRLDYGNRQVVVAIKQGTAASSPSPPSLQRDSSIWELSLAQIYVAAGSSTYGSSTITDERFKESTCGVNLPYGLNHGLQASVRAWHSTSQTINSGSETYLTFNTTSYETVAGMHPASNGAQYLLQAPYPGKYLIEGNLQWASATGGSRIAYIYNDTKSIYYTSMKHPSSRGDETHPISTVADLDAGDRVGLLVFQDAGFQINVRSASQYTPYLAMTRISQ